MINNIIDFLVMAYVHCASVDLVTKHSALKFLNIYFIVHMLD